MTPKEIIQLPMESNDAHAPTIGDYLKTILHAIWREGECFSGKRPFGNSGWEYDVYTALVKGNALPGTLDEDGYLEDIDSAAADVIIHNVIDALYA